MRRQPAWDRSCGLSGQVEGLAEITPAATVESVKAASDVYAPVAGEVVEINGRVVEEPGLVNADPTGNGWLFKIRIGNPAEVGALLDEDAYEKLTK